jgi:hypothetical protein
VKYLQVEGSGRNEWLSKPRDQDLLHVALFIFQLPTLPLLLLSTLHNTNLDNEMSQYCMIYDVSFLIAF